MLSRLQTTMLCIHYCTVYFHNACIHPARESIPEIICPEFLMLFTFLDCFPSYFYISSINSRFIGLYWIRFLMGAFCFYSCLHTFRLFSCPFKILAVASWVEKYYLYSTQSYFLSHTLLHTVCLLSCWLARQVKCGKKCAAWDYTDVFVIQGEHTVFLEMVTKSTEIKSVPVNWGCFSISLHNEYLNLWNVKP